MGKRLNTQRKEERSWRKGGREKDGIYITIGNIF